MPDLDQRIPPVRTEDWTDATRGVFVLAQGPEGWENGSKFNVINMLANHPTLAHAWLTYNYTLNSGCLPAKLREIVVLRVASRYKSEYEWSLHVQIAGAVGLGAEHFAAIREGPQAALWSDLERRALQATDQLCSTHDIDDEIWSALALELDVRQLMELLFVIGTYTMLSWIFAATRLQLEGDERPIVNTPTPSSFHQKSN